MWPFNKSKESNKDVQGQSSPSDDVSLASASRDIGDDAVADSSAPDQEPSSQTTEDFSFASDYDPMSGDCGPFDSRRSDVGDYDFSDFAKGQVDLGSMLIPIPHSGDVQVEVGPDGPQAVHVATPFGRLTPVAFAAPKSGGQWDSTIDEIMQQFDPEEVSVTLEPGAWNREVVATGEAGVVRVLGIDGAGWMFRLSMTGPKDKAAELTQMGRALAARVVVKRGDAPMPAGDVLPVVLPPELVEELNQMIAQREEARKQEEETQRAAVQGDGPGISIEVTKEPEPPQEQAPDDAPATPESAAAAFGHHMPPRRDEPAVRGITDADLDPKKGTNS